MPTDPQQSNNNTFRPMNLLCHKCGGAMSWPEAESLVCPGCGSSYPVIDGVPIIRHRDYYHELLPRDKMRELLERSRIVGWERALENQIRSEPGPRKQALYNVMLDESRAAFKAVLAPLSGKRVLDLGCGSGSTALNLARWAEEVVGCDLTWERVAFLSLRARALGLHNLRTLCAGDTRPLPFPDASFDCVVLNGVLEWSAGDGDAPVRTLQLEFLREVRRILRQEGQIYIGIENRLGFYYFLGQPEDHTGVKYAALLPRPLANAWVRYKTGAPYRTYTYSRAGYQKLLRQAGFNSISFHAPVPDYRAFNEIVPLDSEHRCNDESTGGWRGRLKRKLFRSKWLTPSFGIVASAARPDDSWIVQLTQHVRNQLHIDDGTAHPTIRLSATSSAGLIVFLSNAAIIRVPLDPLNEQRVQRNFDGLRHAQLVRSAGPSFSAPLPLLSETFAGIAYTAESYVPGRTYKSFSPEDYVTAANMAFRFLIELAQHAPRRTSTEDKVSAGKVMTRIRAILDTVEDERQRKSLEKLSDLARQFELETLPVGFSHGDFWWGNILFDLANNQVGLVDWDAWSPAEPATNDFLHFVCYRRVVRDNCTWAEAFSEWLGERNVDGLERQWTEHLTAALKLPSSWREMAALMYWIREVSGHGHSKLQFDHVWTDMMFNQALPSLLRCAPSSALQAHA